MTIFIYAEKNDKIQHPFFIIKEKRNFSKARIEEMFISLIKGTYEKFTENIVSNGEVMKTSI